MRALIQRVKSARVVVEGEVTGEISQGLLVFVAVRQGDGLKEAKWLADKIVSLRLFNDDGGKMNLSCADIGGQLLVVSQFTLYGDCRRGRRPSYSESAPPSVAEPLYHNFIEMLKNSGLVVNEGVFQAHMEVSILNDGPVTVMVDSPVVGQ